MATPEIDIRQAAEVFTTSYTEAVSVFGKDPNARISDIGAGIAAHYGPKFTSFMFGHSICYADPKKEAQSVTAYLEKLVQGGLGINFQKDKHRIEVVSPYSALVYATWSVQPADGSESFAWENVYGYRLVPREGGQSRQEYWEFVVCDNEIAALSKRVPALMNPSTYENH